MTGKMPVLLKDISHVTGLHDSVIYHQTFRVFGGGVGPTRRGANMHLECGRV